MTETLNGNSEIDSWRPADDPAIQGHAFRQETMLLNGRTLNVLSLEYDRVDDQDYTPPDWSNRCAQAMQAADLTLVEYFTPELEQNMPYMHRLGSFSRNVGLVYGHIADIAHYLGKEVAVADLANKPLYEVYHLGISPAVGAVALACAKRKDLLGLAGFLAGESYIGVQCYQAAYHKGTYGVNQSRIERYVPNANDARHVLTARAITQVAQDYPPGSSLLYIASPAHTARMESMLKQPPTTSDSLRAALYKCFIGLDRTTRIYTPTNEGWRLKAVTPIR